MMYKTIYINKEVNTMYAKDLEEYQSMRKSMIKAKHGLNYEERDVEQ